MMPLDLSDPFEKPSPIARLVGAYRWHMGEVDKPMSPAEFAAALNLPLEGTDRTITPAHIRCWEKDFTMPYDEDLEELIRRSELNSWQRQFAQDIQAAKYPWRHAPVSELGIKILGRDRPLSLDGKGT